MKKIEKELANCICEALKPIQKFKKFPEAKDIEFSRPSKKEFGDYSTNIAFKISDKNQVVIFRVPLF